MVWFQYSRLPSPSNPEAKALDDLDCYRRVTMSISVNATHAAYEFPKASNLGPDTFGRVSGQSRQQSRILRRRDDLIPKSLLKNALTK